MLKKSKDVFWPPFFGVSANDNNWKIFGDLLRSLYAISQDFTVTKDFFCCGSKKKHFFRIVVALFDFHFRCSSCQSGNVENYCRKTNFQQQEEVFALLTCPKWTDENERVTNSNSLKGGTNLLLSSTQRFTKQEHSVWKSLQNVSSEFSSIRKNYQFLSNNSQFFSNNSQFFSINSQFFSNNAQFLNNNAQFLSSYSQFLNNNSQFINSLSCILKLVEFACLHNETFYVIFKQYEKRLNPISNFTWSISFSFPFLCFLSYKVILVDLCIQSHYRV